MRFVSIVGTQVMAVLNPLLALKNANYKIEGIDLFTTSNKKSTSHAATIKNFLLGKSLFKPVQVNVIEISDSLEADVNGRHPVQKELQKLVQNGEIAFNLAGGLNFQIAACVYELPQENCLYLYPDALSVHALRLDGGNVTFDDLLPLPDPEDVLRLQGIDFNDAKGYKTSPFLLYALKKTEVTLPVKNIRPVCINKAIFFDHFWNDGNELRFLKVIHVPKEGSKKADHYLTEGRKVIALATTREAFGELYHRRIAILTNNPTVAERLREEGGGKINVIEQTHDKTGRDKELKKGIKIFFESVPLTAINEEETHFINVKGPETEAKSTLYMPLGRNLMPTLIALWTHRPYEAYLLFTPNDPEIQKIKTGLISNMQIIPAKKLCFIPISIEGSEILTLPKIQQDSAQIEVNVSPGTKGHTAFLSFWSKLHGIDMYSLETKSQILQGITNNKRRSLQGPSPLEYLRLSGKVIKATGTEPKTLLSRSKTYDGVNAFIQEMAAEKGNINDFPAKNIDLKQTNYKLLEHQRGQITREQGKRKSIQWHLDEGKWFENFVGYCLLKCGADDVQVRIRTAREPESEKYLQGKYPGEKIFLSDIDVVARFAANYYVISCKATKMQATNITADEIAAMATLWGRFAIPLVAFLKYGDEPFQAYNGVFVFGYKTFTDYEALKNLLQKAIKQKQKTAA